LLFYFAQADLEQQISSLGLRTVLVSSIILVLSILIASRTKGKLKRQLKKPLFALMASTLIVSTFILFGSTIYLNIKSESGGPVHWHADIEYWVCGSEIELRDPNGILSNKIGSATYHEHNDKRIHLEGVVVRKSEDAGFEKFMRVVGGYVTSESIGIPLNKSSDEWLAYVEHRDGDQQLELSPNYLTDHIKQTKDGPVLELKNGQTCNEIPAELQVFVYSFDEPTKTYSQRKLDNPAKYVLRDEPTVPPGDCVIVEFDAPKSRTDKLCQQYGVRDYTRCTQFGVKSFDPKLCNLWEVTSHGDHF